MIRAIVLASVALCVVSGPAGAQSDRPPWARWEQRVHRLDLKPEQREKVNKILDASRKEREAIQALVRQAVTELNELLQQPDAKEQAILHQADKLGELRTERQKAMLRAFLKVRAELTPEQRQQLLAKAPAADANAPRRPLTPSAKETPPVATPATP
jgi:Spy/CpxP family protein refolding chaperone